MTSPPPGASGKIPGGPLYDLGRVHSILKDGEGLLLWTRSCTRNVRDLGWESADVADLLLQLQRSDYRGSEWCESGRGAYAACDAYAIRLREWVAAAHKHMLVEYFVKFAINPAGTVVLAVSCHI